MTELDAIAVSRQLGAIEATLTSLQGEVREFKANTDARFESHGTRLGETLKEIKGDVSEMQGRLLQHIQHTTPSNSNGNGSGWREKTKYTGIGAIGIGIIMGLIEIIKNLVARG